MKFWTLARQYICAAFLDLTTASWRIKELNVSSGVLIYLNGRTHCVKRSNQFSDWQPMLGGIPQGSSLRPLLFLICMNQLPLQVTDGLLVQYAGLQ